MQVNPMRKKTFGRVLRHLRQESGLGIKRLAPQLGVSYSYVSKLENDVTTPSEAFVQKAAAYFDVDPNTLLFAAGKIPSDVVRILEENSERAIALLRKEFGPRDGNR
jgi:transcriptional regulator with XRE-family HTH domain